MTSAQRRANDRETKRRSRTLPLTGIAGVAVGAYWLPGAAAVCGPLRSALGVRDRLDAADQILLSFDDGPHPQATPAVLDLLDQAAVQATFFLAGEQVERRPQLAAEIASAGHEIALHCHRHRCLLRLTPRQTRDDLRRAYAVIGQATGRPPTRYRPPYGIFNAAALTLARTQRWQPLLWSKDGRDWQQHATANSIAARVTRDLRGGDVILLHDADHYSAPGSWRQTIAALPRILEKIDHQRLRAR
jgi:peptidoglycan/xylan/chitin deacetylase (PgdA/CDA1 family)